MKSLIFCNNFIIFRPFSISCRGIAKLFMANIAKLNTLFYIHTWFLVDRNKKGGLLLAEMVGILCSGIFSTPFKHCSNAF